MLFRTCMHSFLLALKRIRVWVSEYVRVCVCMWMCFRCVSAVIKVNKDVFLLPHRQSCQSGAERDSNRSPPHAAVEYFRILIAYLVCCCHMAFISILSSQWGVRPPDVAQMSLAGGVPLCVEFVVSDQCSTSPVHTVSEMMNTDGFINAVGKQWVYDSA